MKALFLGSAPAAALGLLLGSFAHPELAVAPPPMQPVEPAYAWSSSEPPSFYAPPAAPYVSRARWESSLADLPPVPEPAPVPAIDTYAATISYEAADVYATEVETPAPDYPSIAGDILAGTEREVAAPEEATQPDA